MLTVHGPGPTMSSQKRPSNGYNLPFGYQGLDDAPSSSNLSFFPNYFPPNPPAPPPNPAPGNPILTAAERDILSDEMAAIIAQGYGQLNPGEGLFSEEWQMMPPSLVGVQTSLVQPVNLSNHSFFSDTPSQGFSTTTAPASSFPMASSASATFGTSSSLIPTAPSDPAAAAPAFHPPTFATPGAISPVSPLEQDLSPDVIEGATNLTFHNRSRSMHSEPAFLNGSQQQRPPPVGHLRHQPLREFQQEGHRNSLSIDEANLKHTWNGWIFGANAIQSTAPPPQASPPVVHLDYGSDKQFNGNQPFVPQNKKDSFESMRDEHMRYMDAVKLSASSNTTRAPTPTLDASMLALKTRGPPKALKIEADSHGSRRIRKSRSGDDDLLYGDDDDEPQSAVSKTSGRKRKSKAGGDSTESPGADGTGSSSGKRRKSSGAIRKENLTENQKRENHINSEKKRRKVIAVGFDNLTTIVPAIHIGGNHSKSAMLESTVQFLQDLLQGNQQLKAQLDQMSL